MRTTNTSRDTPGHGTVEAPLPVGSGPRPTRVAMQFIATALVWGASFLFITVSVEGFSPVQVVAGRLILGALTLALIMLATRRRWPRGAATWGHIVTMGLFLCVIPFLLFTWAAQFLPSGLSSIYNATAPIATMLVSLAALPEERLTRLLTIALVAALGGIVLVAAPWRMDLGSDRPEAILAQLACLGATTCYGIGFTYTRWFQKHRGLDSITLSASQISSAAVVIALLLPVIGRDPVSPTPAIVLSLVVLGCVGTGIAYIWHTNVTAAWGATAASTVTYLTPITGVLLGALVLGERVRANEIVGVAIVILAILAGQGRLPIGRRRDRCVTPARARATRSARRNRTSC